VAKNKKGIGNKVKIMPVYMTTVGFQRFEFAGNHYTIRLLQNPEDRSFEIITENDDLCKELKYVHPSLSQKVLQYFKGNGNFEALPSEVKADIESHRI